MVAGREMLLPMDVAPHRGLELPMLQDRPRPSWRPTVTASRCPRHREALLSLAAGSRLAATALIAAEVIAEEIGALGGCGSERSDRFSTSPPCA
jgi:hypothetical protein